MKTKNKLDQYVELRLEEWGEWYRKGNDSGIGFPHRNLLARIREEGILSCPTGQMALPEDPAVEEIEKLVQELARQHPVRAEVLRIYYLNPIGAEIKAERRGFSKPHFYAHLKFAREWIKGYLTARKKYF